MTNDDSMTSKEIVDAILDKAEIEETVTVKVVGGVKNYYLNKKGRQFMANRAIYALEIIQMDVTQIALNEFKHYAETGIKAEFVEETLSKLLPFVTQKLADGMTGEEIRKQIEEQEN